MRDEAAERRASLILTEGRQLVRECGSALRQKVEQMAAIHGKVFHQGREHGGMPNVDGARPIREMELQGHRALEHLRQAYDHIQEARRELGDEVGE